MFKSIVVAVSLVIMGALSPSLRADGSKGYQEDPTYLVGGVVTTQADLQALLSTAAAKSVGNPSHFTGITTLKDGATVVLGLNYSLKGGAIYSVSFKIVPMTSTVSMLETNLAAVNTEVDALLMATPRAISNDLFLLNGQLYLIVMIRQ